MKRFSWLAITCLLMVASSVRAQDVRYNYSKDTNFSKFKTYTWVVLKDAMKLDDITDKQIKSAVDAELSKKGLARVDDGAKADLFIGYQAAIGQEKELTMYSSGWGYGGGWYGGWYGAPGMTTAQTSTIYNGQLAIDMYDASGHDLVWRGVATKELNPKAKPDKREKNLAKGMAKLFKNYPPKPKS